ncbi:hypothetical protein DUNSADRAFT_3271 [Dunaliella salina]|uniref:Encoded protein n=1 Tax=Dunaliella salina TaxID=3046 RepID=A0ABQ7FVJ6_DUNSA|nr:hypothetical protein DUNSADRAFT_3271 [Dunaliella salina]|eukprot:KAF5826409.1 hypothetical protein DUNSADRAFT_3271 [Dunaliella salina]
MKNLDEAVLLKTPQPWTRALAGMEANNSASPAAADTIGAIGGSSHAHQAGSFAAAAGGGRPTTAHCLPTLALLERLAAAATPTRPQEVMEQGHQIERQCADARRSIKQGHTRQGSCDPLCTAQANRVSRKRSFAAMDGDVVDLVSTTNEDVE